MSGAVRLSNSEVGSAPGITRATAQARAMDADTVTATVAMAESIDRGHPSTSPAAIPRIGDIRGATSIAPITTAAESSIRPTTAMTTDRAMKRANGPRRSRLWTPSVDATRARRC